MIIQEIREFPTLYIDQHHGSCHESLLRSYQTLEKVKEMLNRGDSKETILEVIETIYQSYPCDSTK